MYHEYLFLHRIKMYQSTKMATNNNSWITKFRMHVEYTWFYLKQHMMMMHSSEKDNYLIGPVNSSHSKCFTLYLFKGLITQEMADELISHILTWKYYVLNDICVSYIMKLILYHQIMIMENIESSSNMSIIFYYCISK